MYSPGLLYSIIDLLAKWGLIIELFGTLVIITAQ